MMEILDHSTLHDRAGEISKSQLKFKAGSFESISKIIDSKKMIELTNECTKIRNEQKEKKHARSN